jgi:hypothetical protein
MARLAISITLLTATFMRQFKMGSTLAFARLKWLRERATSFRYTYIAFLFIKCYIFVVVMKEVVMASLEIVSQ